MLLIVKGDTGPLENVALKSCLVTRSTAFLHSTNVLTIYSPYFAGNGNVQDKADCQTEQKHSENRDGNCCEFSGTSLILWELHLSSSNHRWQAGLAGGDGKVVLSCPKVLVRPPTNAHGTFALLSRAHVRRMMSKSEKKILRRRLNLVSAVGNEIPLRMSLQNLS